ncbi:MAG: hypothetical protein ACOX8N_09315, partial [Christensenellales bacterium]
SESGNPDTFYALKPSPGHTKSGEARSSAVYPYAKSKILFARVMLPSRSRASSQRPFTAIAVLSPPPALWYQRLPFHGRRGSDGASR